MRGVAPAALADHAISSSYVRVFSSVYLCGEPPRILMRGRPLPRGGPLVVKLSNISQGKIHVVDDAQLTGECLSSFRNWTYFASSRSVADAIRVSRGWKSLAIGVLCDFAFWKGFHIRCTPYCTGKIVGFGASLRRPGRLFRTHGKSPNGGLLKCSAIFRRTLKVQRKVQPNCVTWPLMGADGVTGWHNRGEIDEPAGRGSMARSGTSRHCQAIAVTNWHYWFKTTPAWVVGDRLLVGAVGREALEKAIAEAREDM